MSDIVYGSQLAKVALQKLYKDEEMADVHFVFKSGERVPAHKNLLAAASEVYHAMFYGPIKEIGDVQMDEPWATGFVEFLQFFYSNKIKLTMANIGDLMNYGHKYDVTECFNLCVRFLKEHLTPDNVLQAHSLAILFEQKDLQTKCESLIKFQNEGVQTKINIGPAIQKPKLKINISIGVYESQVAKEALEKLYKDEEMADVYFVFKSGERIPAHKILLSAGSEVFRAMFYGPIKEKGDVQMDEASAAGFVEFLQFFYSNIIKLTMVNIDNVMNYVHKYDVTECFDFCVQFLIKHPTPDNVLQVHGLAVLFEQNVLRSKCEHLISSKTEVVLRLPSFLECDRRAISSILEQDVLSCPETVLFEAVMSWVKAASKQEELTRDIIQKHLGDLFYQIRFRSMTYDQFVDQLPNYDRLFTRDELNEIFHMKKSEQFQPMMFNAFRRTPSWDEEDVFELNRHVSHSGCYFIQNTETTTFSTNKSFILGFFKCALIYQRGNYPQKPISAEVTIARVPNEAETQNRSSELIVAPTWKVELKTRMRTKIKLPKPIVIEPKFKYEIRMNFNILEGFNIFIGVMRQVQLYDGTTVTFYNDPLIDGSSMGLIWHLGLNRWRNSATQFRMICSE